MSGVPVSVRWVRADEWQSLRAVRLEALASDPDAFGGTLAHEAGLGEERWRWWAAESEAGTTQRTFVAVDGLGAWCGLALVRLSVEPADEAGLFAMWVAPAVRGRGIAGRLCEACAAWARAAEVSRLRLESVVGNEPALRAYRAAGFEIVGEQTWTGHGRTLLEHVWVRELWWGVSACRRAWR